MSQKGGRPSSGGGSWWRSTIEVLGDGTTALRGEPVPVDVGFVIDLVDQVDEAIDELAGDDLARLLDRLDRLARKVAAHRRAPGGR